MVKFSIREMVYDFKNFIYEPFKSIVLLGTQGAMISAGLMLISATLLKIGLKFVKGSDEDKKEKWNKITNHILKLNLLILLNSIISIIVVKQNKDNNVIIFFAIVILSIIEYIFINSYFNNKEE